MIHEAVVITQNEDGSSHIVPLGYQREGEQVVLAPFRPSATLDNLERTRQAVLNLTDNVQVIAGCLTGRRAWPTVPAVSVDGVRLVDTLVHEELAVERVQADAVRPRFFCRVQYVGQHGAYRGFNRAQSACIEAAILVSRLNRLPADKIDNEMAYLQIAIDKTAGEREITAWNWLVRAVEEHRRRMSGAQG